MHRYLVLKSFFIPNLWFFPDIQHFLHSHFVPGLVKGEQLHVRFDGVWDTRAQQCQRVKRGALKTSTFLCLPSPASTSTFALGHSPESLNSTQRVSSLHARAEIIQFLDLNTGKKVHSVKYSNSLCGFANVVPVTVRRDWAF